MMVTSTQLSSAESGAVWRLAGLAPTKFRPEVFTSADGLFIEYVARGDAGLVVRGCKVLVDDVAKAWNGPDAVITRGILSRLILWHPKLEGVYEADKARHQARAVLDDVLADLELTQ